MGDNNIMEQSQKNTFLQSMRRNKDEQRQTNLLG